MLLAFRNKARNMYSAHVQLEGTGQKTKLRRHCVIELISIHSSYSALFASMGYQKKYSWTFESLNRELQASILTYDEFVD